jgi:hypothetical protein
MHGAAQLLFSRMHAEKGIRRPAQANPPSHARFRALSSSPSPLPCSLQTSFFPPSAAKLPSRLSPSLYAFFHVL